MTHRFRPFSSWGRILQAAISGVYWQWYIGDSRLGKNLFLRHEDQRNFGLEQLAYPISFHSMRGQRFQMAYIATLVCAANSFPTFQSALFSTYPPLSHVPFFMCYAWPPSRKGTEIWSTISFVLHDHTQQSPPHPTHSTSNPSCSLHDPRFPFFP